MFYEPIDCTVEEAERNYIAAKKEENACCRHARKLEKLVKEEGLEDDVCLDRRISSWWDSEADAERNRIYWEDQLRWAREKQKQEVEQ